QNCNGGGTALRTIFFLRHEIGKLSILPPLLDPSALPTALCLASARSSRCASRPVRATIARAAVDERRVAQRRIRALQLARIRRTKQDALQFSYRSQKKSMVN